MTDTKPLTDAEAWDRMHAALEALGDAPGATTAADTALTAARRSLVYLQMGIIKAGEAAQGTPKGPAET